MKQARKTSQKVNHLTEEIRGAVLNSLDIHLVVIDRAGNILEVNEPWRQFATESGVTDPEYTVVNVNYLDVLQRAGASGDESAEAIRLGITEVLNGSRSVYQTDYPCKTPDRTYWFSMKAMRLSDARGGAVITHTDITKRKQMEEGLREGEERFRQMFQRHDAVMLLIEPNTGAIVDANLAAQKFYGYSIEQLKWMKIEQINVLPPDEGKKQRQRATHESLNFFVFPHRLASGEVRMVEVHSSPITANGNVLLFSIVHDITERKKAEDALRASEEKFSSIFQASSTLIAIAEENSGNYFEVNNAWLRTLEYSREEVIGRPPSQLGIFVDANQYRGAWQALCAQGSLREHEITLRTQSGKILHGVFSADWIELQGRRYLLTITNDITERKQVEQALHASEEKYRELVESLDTAVGVVDCEGRFLYMNSTMANRTGGVAEDFIGKTLFDIFPEPVATRQLALARQIIQTDQKQAFEEELFLQGQWRWHYTSVVPLHNEQSRAVSVLIISLDIHELKATQQELQELNRTLEERVRERTAQVQDLYDNAPVGYHSLDADGRLTAINQTELNWLGYTREELLGKPFFFFIAPADHARAREQFQLFKTNGNVRDLELNAIRKDGTRLPISVNAIAIYGADGRYVSSRSTMMDVTERKRAETALHASEERMDLAFRAAQDGIWDWDLETNEVFYSSRYKSMLGYEDSEIEPHVSAWKRLLHPDDLLRAEQVVQAVLRGEREYVMEFRMLHKGGHYVDILSRGFPIRREPNAPIVRIVGTHLDLTERKNIEEALKFANSELERAMHMKDEFLASMSHELRTPLTGILGLSEALEMGVYGELGDKQAKTISTIYESGRHLLELINDLLDLAKVQAGKLDLEFSHFSIADVCQASLQLTKGMAGKKRQVVHFTPPPEPILIHADSRRVKQILVNLLSNAIKFTPEKGELGLEVHADRELETLQLVVWDKGVGIKEEYLQRLFRPFEQIDSKLSREYSGTGLGLSLVRRLADLHHGSIQVESVFGVGSRFIVTLPW